jgi:hypothetical protein
MSPVHTRFVNHRTSGHRVPEKRAKTSLKDGVKTALTPQRVSVLSWAFAAVLFATIGLSSFQFARVENGSGLLVSSGLVLPPGGDVDTTASIRGSGQIGLMPAVNGRIVTADDELKASELETLRKEIVGLRRRLGGLSEQNMAYSRRISALEEQLAAGGTSGAPADTSPASRPRPAPGNVRRSEESRTNQPAAQTAGTDPVTRNETASTVQERIESVPAPETRPEIYENVRKQLSHSGQIALSELRNVKPPEGEYPPVRIVELPSAATDPVTTGSIAPTKTPDERELPAIIEPSKPVGRSDGAGQSMIRHTDFGVVVGRYNSIEDAGKAWLRFQEQNEERMRGLRPIVSRSDLENGAIDLLVGPFGNAADAAVACLRLLEVTGTCHPALFAGEALPELDVAQQ